MVDSLASGCQQPPRSTVGSIVASKPLAKLVAGSRLLSSGRVTMVSINTHTHTHTTRANQTTKNGTILCAFIGYRPWLESVLWVVLLQPCPNSFQNDATLRGLQLMGGLMATGTASTSYTQNIPKWPANSRLSQFGGFEQPRFRNLALRLFQRYAR